VSVVLSTSNLVQPSRDSVMRHAWDAYAGRPVVRILEARLAAFHGTAHCVALCNGFWALVLAMRALALPGRGDVLMPSLTCAPGEAGAVQPVEDRCR
jgi:dTDP-4-amino-4,6-dideoxygalactose transaminase